MNDQMNDHKSEKSAYWMFRRDILIFVGALFALNAIYNASGYGRDDTDAPDERSGLELRTDFGTGCQYLEASSGGLTPRLDADGNHMGCGRQAAREN